MNLSKRIWKLVAAALVAASLSSGALGYWLTSGSGSGSATAATALPVVISPGTPSTALYPGGDAGVAVVVSNPNRFRAYLDKLDLDTASGTAGFAVDSGHAGCDVSALSFTPQTVGQFVPPNDGSHDGTLSLELANAVAMSSQAANACQGATFTVYVKAG